MLSIDLIRRNLERSRDMVLSRIDEMREHCMIHPTPRGGAHTLWTLGHLVYIEGMVIHQFMLGSENPHAAWQEPFDGADVSSDPGTYPPFDEVLDACRKIRASTLEIIGTLGEDDLDKPSAMCPKGFDAEFGTYRNCLQFVADHWYMHRGQLADARRASGIDRMWL